MRALVDTRRRIILVVALTLLILYSSASAQVRGRPQPQVDRFQWVAGLDDLYPRDGGSYLSSPQSTHLPADIPLPDPPFAVDFTHYPDSAEVVLFLGQLETAYPDLVEVTEVGRSWQNQGIMAVRIGDHGTGDADQQPALYIDGQHGAREAVSAQVVLYFVWYLASQYGTDPLVTHLLDSRTVYAIPLVHPDGNTIFLNSDQRQRKTANPAVSDDDADTLFDEDGREEAGLGTYDVYHYEFDADWVAAHPDDPFVGEWWRHLVLAAFVGIFDDAGQVVVQVDDDGDGQTGEDPPGGVDANRNYDSHWELGDDNPTWESYRGPAAFSEPETRAVRDFVQARPNIATASTVHSGSDLLLHPWGWSSQAELPDRFWYELMSRKGSQLTETNGFHGAPHTWTARGLYPAPGNALDWLYERGVLAWSPQTYARSARVSTERIGQTNTYIVTMSMGEGFNPDSVEIPLTADRWLRWHLYLLAATPNVGLSRVTARNNTLTVTVANDGLLPLNVDVTVETESGVARTTVDRLTSAEWSWSVPLQPGPPIQTATITLAAVSKIGTAPGPQQAEVVEVEIQGDTVRVLQGRLEPFTDLGSFFGGWFAGLEWDTHGEYHLGPPLLHGQFLPLVLRNAR
jgi:hypothetical protein